MVESRVLSLAFLAIAAVRAGVAAGLEVAAARASGPVKIDGALSEPAWTSAAAYPLVTYDGKRAAYPTEVWTLFDDERVYFAFVCHEEHIDGLAAKETRHDGDVWKDDCVEVFLDPVGKAEAYFHFMANTLGTKAEEKAVGKERDGSWNVEWEAAAVVDVEGKLWTAEIAIPLAGLELPFEVTSEWRFNLNRERQEKAGTKSEFQGLVATPRGFHSPEQFAVLAGLDIDYFPYRASALGRRLDAHARACADLVGQAENPEHARPDIEDIRFESGELAKGIDAIRGQLAQVDDEAKLAFIAERLGLREAKLAELTRRLRTRLERPDDELF